MEVESTIELDLERPADTLLITFGGIAQGIGVARFEFCRILEGVPAKTMYIRDVSQSWYHGHLPGVGVGVEALREAIAGVREDAGSKRVVCVGNSMGGYAALLLGSLVRADRVVAFAPQAFVSRWLRFRHWDRRWKKQIQQLHKSCGLRKATYDLQGCLGNPGYLSASIYSDRSSRLDAIHARRLSKTPRTKIHWREGGHGLVKGLRDTGELREILIEACGDGNSRMLSG